MKEEEVYVKVSVDDELPQAEGFYTTLPNFNVRFFSKFFDSEVTHWLKPTTGILLSKQELVNLIVLFTEKYSEGNGTKFLKSKGLL